jgi:HNH endonuclease
MAFNRDAVARLLVECHRRCCICHRFCGFKMETDHMNPTAEGGSDDIDNAIPVCFECHAEIHLYNPALPRGRRYTAAELRSHKEQWIETCRTSAHFLASVPSRVDVGPLQGMVDELEFNEAVVARPERDLGCPLESARFADCLANGAISLMADDLKAKIYGAYAAIKYADTVIRAVAGYSPHSTGHGDAFNRALTAVRQAAPEIGGALQALRAYLRNE